MIFTYTSKGKRNYNEDRIDILKDERYIIMGVYDGHGGSQVSEFLKIHANKIILDCLKNNYNQHFGNLAYKIIDQKIRDHLGSLAHKTGSTSIHLIIDKTKRLYTYINLGDCRLLKILPNLIQLNTEHKPDLYDEKIRIEKSGGKVILGDPSRINGYSVSRSFGDLFNTYISKIPEISTWKPLANTKNIFLMATDGLWDVMENKDISIYVKNNFLRKEKSLITQNLKTLVDIAIEKGSTDNISLIYCEF